MNGFDVFMEVVGYIGTALVILSMLMTSVVKLRILNICGSLLSVLYALEGQAFPVVLLNASLITINVIQLVRMRRKKTVFHEVKSAAGDPNLAYFLALHADDIEKYYPAYSFKDQGGGEVHLAYCGSEVVGVLIGRRDGDCMTVELDYSTQKYRDLSVSKFLYEGLREGGVRTLTATQNAAYFRRMGFAGEETLVKKL